MCCRRARRSTADTTSSAFFTARTGGVRVTEETVVSLDDPQTLYAQWRLKTYRATFDPAGGSCAACEGGLTVAYGASYENLPEPSRGGYLFDGWWLTPDYARGTEVKDGDGVVPSDVTLYAKWLRRALWYEDGIFHLESAATYAGYLLDGNDVVAVTIE